MKSVRVCISTRPTHRGSGIPIEIERAVEPHADMWNCRYVKIMTYDASPSKTWHAMSLQSIHIRKASTIASFDFDVENFPDFLCVKWALINASLPICLVVGTASIQTTAQPRRKIKKIFEKLTEFSVKIVHHIFIFLMWKSSRFWSSSSTFDLPVNLGDRNLAVLSWLV